ncbi:hypothetical protein D6T64_12260 [Cryobacterium melibiosiphilum]|uniref:TadE-like domain-containing protein n=1 Tax=Cryobacterium melibiosiphilum TaxID=995039 RepID=A0A3A5MJQ2_9MICO|nr:TadE family type IV pilus minor pilin [Cryobacterium melibiosiphilum]RJT88149.1 hypothetical protein D6T64_12260 [Cryobacterium melibiosiphilum]
MHGAQRAGGRDGTHEAGAVTAELAAVLPAVVLVLGLCLGAVQVVGQQVRLTDAAADSARALARGETQDQAAQIARQLVATATLDTEADGQFVCARLSAPSGIGPFAAFGLILEARSCALAGGL